MKDRDKRQSIIDACLRMNALGINQGTSGNISLRHGDGLLITPTSTPYETMRPEQIVQMGLDGSHDPAQRPSSEWRFHRDIFQAREEVGAIVHTHSPQATALACTGRGIPAFHYMVAVAGGSDIRCAPYHGFGTQELSDAALAALQDRRACLLANHGVIALGADLPSALALAAEVENLAVQYCAALALGRVTILDEAEMRRVVEKFRTYGTQDAVDPGLVFGGAQPGALEGS